METWHERYVAHICFSVKIYPDDCRCLFYIVLRGLNTIEDDMTIPDKVKQPILRSFHIHTVTPGWTFDHWGPKEKDRQLLVEYDAVVEELNRLNLEYRSVSTFSKRPLTSHA